MKDHIASEAQRLLKECRRLLKDAEELAYECRGAGWHGVHIPRQVRSQTEAAEDLLYAACQALEGVRRAL